MAAPQIQPINCLNLIGCRFGQELDNVFPYPFLRETPFWRILILNAYVTETKCCKLCLSLNPDQNGSLYQS